MKKTLNKIKKIGIHGMAFAFVVYSGMITCYFIGMILFAMTMEIQFLPILITIIISASLASVYYLKMFPEGSDKRNKLSEIINPYGKIKPGNLQAGVFGLFMALTLHVSSFLMPGSIIETVIVKQSDAFGYFFIYSIVVLGTILVLSITFSWALRKIYKSTAIPPKSAVGILIITFVFSILAIVYISSITKYYQPIISIIGLLVIGSIPIGILSVLFRPGSYLE